MKNVWIPTLSVAFAMSSLCAQQPATSEKLELIPSQPSRGQTTVTPAPLPLIPETPELTKKPKSTTTEVKKERRSSTEAAADALQQRIRFRQAKTRASNDPAVQAEWARANAARTDFEKRDALKAYYKALFNRMRRVDGSLRARIAETEQRAMKRLTQTRIDPTEPIDPEERTDRFGE